MPEQRMGKWKYWLDAFCAAITGPGILYLIFATACIGLFYARALPSIFSGILIGITLLNWILSKDSPRELSRYPALLALMGIFLVYVFSAWHSDDLGRWWKLTWDNALYVFIPLGFYTFRNVPSGTWTRLLMIFVLACTLSAISVMADYVLHFAEYNELYKVGKTIPTPIIHVRYSYFLAVAACLGLAIAYQSHRSGRHAERLRKFVMLGAGVFLAIVVHLLAVRTGMIALYGGLAAGLACMVFIEGRWKLGLISAATVIVLFVIAYNAFPSVTNKVAYVMYDLKMLRQQGATAEYSDNVRITSIRHGLTLLEDKLITGTGIGDLNTDIEALYAEKTPAFPAENRYPPISQYFYWLTAFGIVGTGVLLFFLLYPLFKSRFNYFLIVIYATTLCSAIGETTIELQRGKVTFLMLVCVALLLAGTASRTEHYRPE